MLGSGSAPRAGCRSRDKRSTPSRRYAKTEPPLKGYTAGTSPFGPDADCDGVRKQLLWSQDDRDEVQMVIAQLLLAIAVGLALAVTGWLAGLPDWLAPLPYVIGMGVTLAWTSRTSSPMPGDAHSSR